MPEIIPHDASGGIPKWVLWGGAAASVLGLFVFLSKGQSGGGTVAAGTSINAALGSLQEQQLQMQGDVSKLAGDSAAGFTSVNANISGSNDAISKAIADAEAALTGQIGTQGTAMTSRLTDIANAQTVGISSLQGEIGGVSNQVSGVGTQLGAGITGLSQQQSGIWQRIMADFTALEAGGADPRIAEWIALSSATQGSANQSLNNASSAQLTTAATGTN